MNVGPSAEIVAIAGAFRWDDLDCAPPIDRILAIREGVPACEAREFLERFGGGGTAISRALGCKPSAISRAAKVNSVLGPAASERLIGLSILVVKIQTMVEESGEPEGFDAHEWFSAWLRQPLPAYGGSRPIDYLDTIEGQAMISRTLGQIQAGVYV